MNRLPIQISAAAYILLAVAILILPLGWILAAITAAVFHEVFHLAAVYLCGGSVMGIAVGERGAVISVAPMKPWKELICALAGPLGGLLLLAFARYTPRIAVCAAFQSLYNLLPIYPLDGGRAVQCMAQIAFPKYFESICLAIEWICLIFMACLSIYACFWLRLGLLPMFLCAVTILRKKPCKEGRLRLQ